MSDIDIRVVGRCGRITLNRPDALNALTYDMCRLIDKALRTWATDDGVVMIVLDGAGEKAFCAGGDIAEMYATGLAGNVEYGRTFWADEYRMNARLFNYAKPVVSFLQGFTMGGGVGVGCHGTHRIVTDTSRIAMPECGIGLVPDVGGSLLLARAPGHLGEYLGTTATRMGPGDAIMAGFADVFVPGSDWRDLLAALEASGDPAAIGEAARPAPPGTLADVRAEVDGVFAADGLADVLALLDSRTDDWARATQKALARVSPLSAAVTLALVRQVRAKNTIEDALRLEYRVTSRSMEHGDFIEGIRAAIIDKDRNPTWRHSDPRRLDPALVDAMLAPLGEKELDFNT